LKGGGENTTLIDKKERWRVRLGGERKLVNKEEGISIDYRLYADFFRGRILGSFYLPPPKK